MRINQDQVFAKSIINSQISLDQLEGIDSKVKQRVIHLLKLHRDGKIDLTK